MNIEKVTWAAVSGAAFTVFWPWMLAHRMLQLSQAAVKPIQK